MDDVFSLASPLKKPFLTSVFTIVEVASAGERLVRSQVISKAAYGKIIQALAHDADQSIHFLSMDDGIIFSAAEMVKRYGLRPGDAIHLASLKRSLDIVNGFDLEIVLIAADRLLCSAAAKEGFVILNPDEYSRKEWKKKIK